MCVCEGQQSTWRRKSREEGEVDKKRPELRHFMLEGDILTVTALNCAVMK